MLASASTLPSDFPSRIVFLFAIVGSQAYILGLLLPLVWNTTRTPPFPSSPSLALNARPYNSIPSAPSLWLPPTSPPILRAPPTPTPA